MLTVGTRSAGLSVLAVLLVACSALGGGDDGPTIAPQFADGDVEAMKECLAEIGFPQPAIDEFPAFKHPAWEDERWDPAAILCLEDAGLGEFNGDDPEEVTSYNAMISGFVRCLEERGWDIPPPSSDELGMLIPEIPNPTDDPEALAAMLDDSVECGELHDFPFIVDESES